MIGDFPQKQKQPKPMPPPSHLPIFPGQLSTTQRHVPRKLWSFWLTLGAPSMEQAKSEGGTKGGTSGSQKEEKTRLGCEYLLLIPWHTVGFLLWFQFKSTSLSLLWYWFLLPHCCLIINVYHPFDIFGRNSNTCGFSFIPFHSPGWRSNSRSPLLPCKRSTKPNWPSRVLSGARAAVEPWWMVFRGV